MDFANYEKVVYQIEEVINDFFPDSPEKIKQDLKEILEGLLIALDYYQSDSLEALAIKLQSKKDRLFRHLFNSGSPQPSIIFTAKHAFPNL